MQNAAYAAADAFQADKVSSMSVCFSIEEAGQKRVCLGLFLLQLPHVIIKPCNISAWAATQ